MFTFLICKIDYIILINFLQIASALKIFESAITTIYFYQKAFVFPEFSHLC